MLAPFARPTGSAVVTSEEVMNMAPPMVRANPTRLRVLPIAAFIVIVSAGPAAQQSVLFTFHSNPWLNLHHFVRANARTATPPTGLTNTEETQWTAGTDFYRDYAQRDVLDDGMVAIKYALRSAEGKRDLDAVALDPTLKTVLERLMPIYRRRWWSEHDHGNREWIAAIQPLIEQHGAAISKALTRAYAVTWPQEPIYVDVSVTAGPAGSYTTSDPTPHVVISSTDTGYRGYRALEMIFHESSHALGLWPILIQPLERAASEQQVILPPQLWHAVLFYTAGELTTRELAAHGIDYTPYADADFYTKMCGLGCRNKIAEHWKPHLDGKRPTEAALRALVEAFK
jgi:hypothetical protein